MKLPLITKLTNIKAENKTTSYQARDIQNIFNTLFTLKSMSDELIETFKIVKNNICMSQHGDFTQRNRRGTQEHRSVKHIRYQPWDDNH